MKKVKTFLVILSLAVSIGAVGAQADGHEEEERAWNVTFDSAGVSKYIWRGQELAGGSWQPGITLSNWGFLISSWSNVAPNTAVSSWTEHDLTVDYGFAVTDKISANIGYINYAFPNLGPLDRYSNEISAGLAYDTFLSPSVTVYGDFGHGNGMYYSFGIGHSVPIGPVDRGIAMNLSASLGYNQGQWIDKSTVSDVVLGVSLDIPFSQFSISPFLQYITGDKGLRGCEGCFYYTGSLAGVSVSYSY